MIHDLDHTLRELLKHELLPNLAEQVSISFTTPDDQFPPSGVTPPAINLFLYDIRENHDLQQGIGPILEHHTSGQIIKTPPPIKVDYSYMITAWSEFKQDPSEQEHYLLGEVIKVLLRHPTIPKAILQGELAGQESLPRTTILQSSRSQFLGEFWRSLGTRPKAAINYVVTIYVQAFEAIRIGPPITDIQINFKLIEKEG